jgi:hypothetical protein
MSIKILNLIIIFILLPNFISAWDWNTHKSIVEELYYSIPYELQSQLSLELLKKGSIAPDKIFHDNRLHHFPPSYNKTLYWLNTTNHYISIGDYNNASYSFGIATHYISDSFVAPHSVSGEDYKLHSKFEKSPIPIKTKCQKQNYNLCKGLEKAELNGNDWEIWLKNQTKKIPQKELDQAMQLIFPLFLKTFNTTCEERTTIFKEEKFQIGNKTKNYLIFIIIFFMGNIKIKYFSKLIDH